jgi:nitrite reductase/ring-hydroxylating ferredoxin subunit
VQYRGKHRDAILIRHTGEVYGYLNQCAHMPRRLDCEDPRVFDDSGRFLRCSMHGIIYDPASGACQSEICAGASLTPLGIVETAGAIYLQDKRAEIDAE